MKSRNYSGWKITNQKEALAKLADLKILPIFETVIFEHVTYKYPATHKAPRALEGFLVQAVSNEYIQAIIVEINGTTIRPDGKKLHVTFSLKKGHRPVESNQMLSLLENKTSSIETIMLPERIPVKLEAF